MINERIETRVYFDSTLEEHEKSVKLAKHLYDCDKEKAWEIYVTTVATMPSIFLIYPVTEAEAVAKALTSFKETKDD